MSGIVRNYFRMSGGEKVFFITDAEIFWLRQRNWVEEDVFLVTSEFWEKHPRPFGMETLENLLIEKEGEKPFMILTEYKYADKIFRRSVIPILKLKVTSLINNYFFEENGQMVYDEIHTDINPLKEFKEPFSIFIEGESLEIVPFVIEKDSKEGILQVDEGVLKIKIFGDPTIHRHNLC